MEMIAINRDLTQSVTSRSMPALPLFDKRGYLAANQIEIGLN